MPDSGFSYTHESEWGKEPILTNNRGETALPKEKIVERQVEAENLPYRLDELTQDFYMFTLMPLYLVIPNLKPTVIYEYARDRDLDRIKVISYRAPVPLFSNMCGAEFFLQGVPLEHRDLFRTYVSNAYFIGHPVGETKREFWCANQRTVQMVTPTVVAAPAPVDVFVPTGEAFRLEMRETPSGIFEFRKHKPEQWVQEKALNYFATGGS